MSKTRSSSIQVALPQCIPYALWHGKVAKPFKARPLELTALGLGPAVPSHQQARPAGMKPLRRCFDRRWSCSSRLLHGDASSLTATGRRSGVPHGLLWPGWGTMGSHDQRRQFPPLELWPVQTGLGSPHWDVMSSCRFSRSSKGGHPQLVCRDAHRDPLRSGLALLSVGHPRCHE
jgi:hypothetical protein